MGLHSGGGRKRLAADGEIWICGACARSGKDRYNIGDESCMLNAVLCVESSIKRAPDGRIVSADPVESGKAKG